MGYNIQFNLFTFLFHTFAWLADQTGGWAVFAKPKIVFGTLVLSLGVTACGNAPDNSSAIIPIKNSSSKFTIKVKPDSVKVDTSEEEDIKIKPATTIGGLTINESAIYCYVPGFTKPNFPEGEAGLMNYLNANTHYSQATLEMGIQGTVIYRFMVNEDGSISDINMIKSADWGLDSEALRVIKSMSKWNAGEEKTEITIAFVFKIITENTKTESDTIRHTEADYEIMIKGLPEIKKRDLVMCYVATVTLLYQNAYFHNDLKDYIEQNLIYPPQAQADSIEGTVVCQFKVSKRGRISRVKILQSVHPMLDKEAVRLIKSMPKWIPAHKKDKPVKSKTTLKIEFEL